MDSELQTTRTSHPFTAVDTSGSFTFKLLSSTILSITKEENYHGKCHQFPNYLIGSNSTMASMAKDLLSLSINSPGSVNSSIFTQHGTRSCPPPHIPLTVPVFHHHFLTQKESLDLSTLADALPDCLLRSTYLISLVQYSTRTLTSGRKHAECCW
jgi:hypothetical protein